VYIPLSAWLPAFLATIAIEAPIIGFAFRRISDNFVATAVVFLFGNLATHLAIWYVETQFLQAGSLEFFAVAEAWAAAGEALLFWAAIPRLSALRAAISVVIANGASAAVGLATASASGRFLPWP
jgi:hypothetical protein